MFTWIKRRKNCWNAWNCWVIASRRSFKLETEGSPIFLVLVLTKVYGLGVKLAHVNEGQCNCTWGDMLDRLDAFSGMHISQSFSYRLDAKKLQLCWNFTDTRQNSWSSLFKSLISRVRTRANIIIIGIPTTTHP